MKTNKTLFVGLATIAVIATTISLYSVSAATWNGMWHGLGIWRNSGNGNTMRMTHDEALVLSGVATSPLSDQEKLDLAYQYSEEMVARDAYAYFYSLYKIQNFQNIATSEQEHMNAVKALLERYSLPIPTTYGELSNTFTTLKAEWEKWAKEALEVGIKIEMLDIKDIVDTIKTTDNDDIKIVLTNIWGASYNHLRGFVQGLTNNGFTTTLDYSAYLSQADINTRWSLKSKLSEKLTAEWIKLPTQASVSAIQIQNAKDEKNMNIREGYRQNIEKNYGKRMGKMNQSQLSKYDSNLDKTINRINNSSNMSSEKKAKSAMVCCLERLYSRTF